MIPSFDPREFRNLAVDILSQDQSEARLRTAIGRVYYASFLLARKKTGVMERAKIHKKVIDALKAMPGHSSIASQLDALRRLRTMADYDLAIKTNWRENWSKALELADRLLSRL